MAENPSKGLVYPGIDKLVRLPKLDEFGRVQMLNPVTNEIMTLERWIEKIRYIKKEAKLTSGEVRGTT